jgi:hypothetical protein
VEEWALVEDVALTDLEEDQTATDEDDLDEKLNEKLKQASERNSNSYPRESDDTIQRSHSASHINQEVKLHGELMASLAYQVNDPRVPKAPISSRSAAQESDITPFKSRNRDFLASQPTRKFDLSDNFLSYKYIEPKES